MPSVYKKNFLTDVIFRIDYSPILVLVEDKPKEFQSKIVQKFPILEPKEQMGLTIKKEEGQSISTHEAKKISWVFKNKDESIMIELDAEYLSVVVKKYSSFTEFGETIKFILSVLFECYPSIVMRRIGLRYINQIKLNEKDYFDWKSYLNSDLVSFCNFFEEKKQIRRVINSIFLKIDEMTSLNFRYGIFNPVYPNEIIEKEFVLDYDCFTREVIENTAIFDVLIKFNGIITSFFERSISQTFRDKILN